MEQMERLKKAGKVYLVGAGPGDPELLTLKGERILRSAEVLVYDRLAAKEFLSLTPETCEKIYVGKAAGNHSAKQEEINRILVEKALSGKIVVRLKGGDPFVFGRGGEEILELERNGIAYEVVCGVTSAIAALADAGIPVTHRGVSQSFHVITGHTAVLPEMEEGDFTRYGSIPGTLIFLMGLSNMEKIVGDLLKAGKAPETPAAVVTEGTLPGMRCVRASLKELPGAVRKAGLKSPGIIVVGETAALHMSGRKKGPLYGVTVGVTGTDSIYQKIADRLSGLGATVARAGVLGIVKENEDRLLKAVKELAQYDWILFTSSNGVRLFFEAMKAAGTDVRSLGSLKFAVIGPGTGECLSRYGIFADYMPKEYSARALAEGVCGVMEPGSRVFIPRAKGGSKELTKILEDGGFSLTDLSVYDVCPVKAEGGSQTEGLDYLTFESGSGVRAFFAAEDRLEAAEGGSGAIESGSGAMESGSEAIEGGVQAAKKTRIPERTKAVCIGKITERELKKFGVTNALTAEEYTAEGLVQAILRDQKKRAGEKGA